ncbi:hypothetical protein FDUTEX481_02196 [Tolypothrix sp. PCC 7601]|nr:hypothetical protein FDUTEX481_02196 [Tolypothrix sp. PCC 7601]
MVDLLTSQLLLARDISWFQYSVFPKKFLDRATLFAMLLALAYFCWKNS